MRILYDIFFIIFAMIYVPYLLFKGKGHREFIQKFGFLPKEITSLKNPIWIHAVSVGEAVLASKLAKHIKDVLPETPVVVSTTTRTGNDMARKRGKEYIDGIFYYPLDLSFITSGVVKKIDPSLYVMIETELWPNLLAELKSKGIPILMANGRISDKSFGNYKKIKFITSKILKCIGCFCMQSRKDAEKIIELGAAKDDVTVCGNMKFDGEHVADNSSDISEKDLGFSAGDDILVAGSTHFPEETAMIDVYKDIKKTHKDIKLILAPRHTERIDAVKIYAEKSGLKYWKFSDVLNGRSPASGNCDIMLVDTIGHLKKLYKLGVIIFIGGSIAKKGGQNPIEAAQWGKAVVFGPHMYNFREISEIFLENKTAIQIKDIDELKTVLKRLLDDPGKREKMARRSRQVIEKNAGAVYRTIDKICEYAGEKQADETS